MPPASIVHVRAASGPKTLAVVVTALAATLSAAPSVHQGRDIVVLVSQLDPTNATPAHVVDELGGTVVRPLPIIDGFAARIPAFALSTLRRTPGLRSVTPDAQLHLESQYGQDSGIASAVYVDVVRAAKTWATGDTGQDVTVAVVDTGINTSGDLGDRVIHAEDFTGENNNEDTYGHGTFVAGLIAGNGDGSDDTIKGVAPHADLVSLKIATADGSTDVTRVLESLEWILDFRSTYNIRVLNLSIGFASKQSYVVDPLDFAIERVWNAGVVVVAAAGNGGNSPGTITTPGNDPFVITVGASNDRTTVSMSDDKVASFSSAGPTVDGLAKPDLVAPGRSVVSSRSPGSTVDVANPTSEIGSLYAKGSGTSFSTAVVSGVAALVLSQTPTLTPNQVKYRLVSTARTLTTGPSALAGAGVVNAYAATTSSSLASANSGVAPSVGGGSLQATRGAACLADSSGACLSDTDADAALGFDPTGYLTTPWSGSQWVGSQWVGSQWVGSQWVGSQWVSLPWLMAP